MDDIVKGTDRVAQSLTDVLQCLRELAELQKAQLVMLREQSDSLHELTNSIGRLTMVADKTGNELVGEGADSVSVPASTTFGAPASTT